MTDPHRAHKDAIAVIVVNWNGWQLSLDCLKSLRESVGVTWHLFLVDNASTDQSRAKLVALGSDVTVILSDINSGWTGGNNLGLERALSEGFGRFFILNNDAMVNPDTMAKLVAYSVSQPKSPVVGPIHLDGGGKALDFIGTTLDDRTGLPKFRNVMETDFATLPEVYDTAFIKGAAIFATREHFENFGLFDDRYYLNCDEMDWCFRAREHGYPVSMLKNAAIRHIGSASIGGGLSPLNIYFLTRNSLLFAEVHCALRQRVFHFLELFRWGTTLVPKTSKPRRFIALIFGNSVLAIAWRQGLSDYMRRRFGNCPPSMRALSKSK
jgi:GT2 family glycosyltransferase